MSNNKLYVGNLSFNTTEASLSEAFRPYGNVTRATLVTDRETVSLDRSNESAPAGTAPGSIISATTTHVIQFKVE